jgi:6-phosphofructokinase 1
VSKNLGYELRCADPIPHDMEYTRDLGYCAAQYLLEGGSAAMVSIQGGQFVPIPFPAMLDPETGRARIRLVDVHSSRYLIARRYMIRLLRSDFEDDGELESLARVAGLSPTAFRDQFAYVTAHEPAALRLGPDGARG